MAERRTKGLGILFPYYQQRHKELEQMRVEALKRGERATYGYWKPPYAMPLPVVEPTIDDTPPTKYLGDYKLEITYKEANNLIRDGCETINLVCYDLGKWYLTYKNALKLPNLTFIRDINNRWCLFWRRKFYRLL